MGGSCKRFGGPVVDHPTSLREFRSSDACFGRGYLLLAFSLLLLCFRLHGSMLEATPGEQRLPESRGKLAVKLFLPLPVMKH